MLINAVSATSPSENADVTEQAVASFLSFIERRLGVVIVRDGRKQPREAALAEPFRLAALLREKGIIKDFFRTRSIPDEPRLKFWSAICNDHTSHQTGGASWESESDALYAALAEALERYIWFSRNDYFVDPTKATIARIAQKGPFIAPDRFSGYTDAQRAGNPQRRITPETEFLWIQGRSLVQDAPAYVPAQVVSGVHREHYTGSSDEPYIRPPITIGLATWPTQAGARCAGMNEALEREAYMIMWLNQMTLPRIALRPLRERFPSLDRSLALCERYRLKVHAIQMPTDAPTHAVAVMLEDESGIAPRFTIGIRGHRSLPHAIQKALAEAVRAHRGYRSWIAEGNTWDPATPAKDVGHRDRLYYWGVPEHAAKLEFLIEGPETAIGPAAWDEDTEAEHLTRIVAWCNERGIECVAVSLGNSPTNPTPLHIEMMVMPELQWTYLTEASQVFGGSRWRDVPLTLGYTPRAEPFADTPHPFS